MCLCRQEANDSSVGVRQASSNSGGDTARPLDQESSSPERARKPPTPQATAYSHQGVTGCTAESSTTAGNTNAYSHQGVTGWAADSSTKADNTKVSTDMGLSMSGVMPRREDLPAPSTNLGLSRVFKVIFLGKLCHQFTYAFCIFQNLEKKISLHYTGKNSMLSQGFTYAFCIL